MQYEIVYTDKYLQDVKKHKKNGNKKLVKKLEKFEQELQSHPRTGTGKVEQLKYYKNEEIYSRRIDREHRLVYEIIDEKVIVILISAFGHYR